MSYRSQMRLAWLAGLGLLASLSGLATCNAYEWYQLAERWEILAEKSALSWRPTTTTAKADWPEEEAPATVPDPRP